jgi:succinate dehydrogenase / fumarate reductase iron-sulfur subunit
MATVEVPLLIFRCTSGQQPHYDSFRVRVADTASVLDVIDVVWAEKDHSLTFRRACHHASCGSCALLINGVEKLPCITRLADVWDGSAPLRVDPLRNLPVVSDLVVDVRGLFGRMAAAEMDMTRRAEAFLPLSVDDLGGSVAVEPVQPVDGAAPFTRFESCIECGICLSACPTMATDDRFLGPAGLAGIHRRLGETDDPAEAEHLLALADGEHGVWRCHSAYECTEVCPQGVDPAGRIAALRRELTRRRLRGSREERR